MEKRRSSFERVIVLRALVVSFPALLTLLLLLFLYADTPLQGILIFVGVLVLTGYLMHRFVQQMLYPINTVTNLLEALREGDYTLRATQRSGALGVLISKVNHLSETLRTERLRAEEASALLNKVLDEVDVAVLAFDENTTLRLANRRARSLLQLPTEALDQLLAEQLGLRDYLTGAPERIEHRSFAGGQGRYEIHRRSFRDRGREHQLLVLSDLTRALREQERAAWQRLIRVLGHELNNSLTPIRSIAQSLARIAAREPLPADWRDDMSDGLNTIADRSAGLSRFLSAYASLARLPAPRPQNTELAPLMRRAVKFDPRMTLQLTEGEAITIWMDADQIEQALINLIKNAIEASLVNKGAVMASWSVSNASVRIEIIDEGPGLANFDNLFVPFFTTKPGGSGIGLVLARQIVEAHFGTLSLNNRLERTGCVAIIELPIQTNSRPEDRETNPDPSQGDI